MDSDLSKDEAVGEGKISVKDLKDTIKVPLLFENKEVGVITAKV
jgi:hypothetical protein